MEIGLVRHVDIQSEMEQSYLDYAMSVIVSRALPDARDGLKPVHRRILYAMHQMGLRPETPFRKSARIVGEVLGKYHPHGDMAVYDAMARLAQDFSLRYQLVEGQGNFGSVDGDPPAAMRYTEARLSPFAMDMLADIDQDTVDFEANFDGSMMEPVVLPAAVPNMLVNGATGIAVGMSTSIPPHNLSEVVEALILLLEQWEGRDEVSLEELMARVHGPDFPTGGTILRGAREGEGMITAYASGRGKIVVQARAHFEAMGRGRSRIIVTELPYQTNKSNLIEKIADLARAGKLDGITDLRDETDREGMRVVIELAKGTEPADILTKLYKSTTMQSTFSMIMLALVDGQPRLLNLKQALTVYLEHRQEIVRRRSQHELTQKEARLHVLDGLQIALSQLDDIIDTIRKSTDVPQARQRLQKRFELSEVQALAILEMPLRRLASLERKKIAAEHKETKARIKALKKLLGSDEALRQVISEELVDIKSRYGDRRRTVIVDEAEIDPGAPLTASDLAPSKATWVVLAEDGRLSRTTTARLPRLSGRSAPSLVLGANARDRLYLFDEDGNGGCLAVHTIPETDDPERGTPYNALCGLPPGVLLVSGVSIPSEQFERDDCYLMFGTRQAMVKKTAISELPPPSAQSFTAVKINRGDRLGWTSVTGGDSELLLVSKQGMAIRFSEDDVRPMGLAAAGVNGMRLAGKKDEVVGMMLVQPDQMALLLARDGRGKRTKLSEFPTQGRYGKGVLAWPSDDSVEIAGATAGEEADRATAVLSRQADRSIRLGDVPKRARTGSGVSLFEVAKNDRVKQLRPVLPRGEAPAAPPSKRRKKSSRSRKKSPSSRSSKSNKSGGSKKSAKAKGGGGKKSSTKKKSSRS